MHCTCTCDLYIKHDHQYGVNYNYAFSSTCKMRIVMFSVKINGRLLYHNRMLQLHYINNTAKPTFLCTFLNILCSNWKYLKRLINEKLYLYNKCFSDTVSKSKYFRYVFYQQRLITKKKEHFGTNSRINTLPNLN